MPATLDRVGGATRASSADDAAGAHAAIGLTASDPEAKLRARVRQLDFGSQDVEQMLITLSVEFLPP